MAAEKYHVTLSKEEVAQLDGMVRAGKATARETTRARVLLLANEGESRAPKTKIAEVLRVSRTTVKDICKRYCERGLDGALTDAPRPGQPKKLTAAHEAFVIATACTDAPEGHDHWTLEALRDKLLETYRELQSVSHERIRQILIGAKLKPWREKNVVHSRSHASVS